MSDGPHRSLPMRSGWKKVAEFAENEAFAAEEISDAIVVAVEGDWRKEISARFVACIGDVLGGATLFREDSVRELENLRQSVSGNPMANALLDELVYVINEGRSGDTALREAVTATATDWSARCARQVEEHYLRKSNTGTSKNVRNRIEDAIQSASFTTLVNHVLDSEPKSSPKVRKRDGVDDGVPL